MAITSMTKIFAVSTEEYGFAEGGKPLAGGKYLNMNIPKLNGYSASKGTENLSADSMFDNDPACKITYSKKITKSKLISCQLLKNGNWLNKLNASGNIPGGTKFTVRFINSDINKPYVTTE